MNNLPLLHSYNSIKKKLAEATIKFEQETEQLRAALAEKDKEMHWKVQRLTAENLKLVKQVERRPQTSHRLERKVAEWRTASQISTRTEDILYHHDTSRLKDLEEAYSVLNTAYDAERNEYKLFKEQKELQLQNIQQLYSESVNDYEVIVSQYHACQLKIEELSNTIQKLTTDAQADKEQFNSELIRWNGKA